MKNKIFWLLILAGGWLLALTPRARANEGRVVLEAKGVRCEGVSVWRDGYYKLVGKCYGLQYPYKNEYDRYYLWVEDEEKGTDVRVVEVVRGYFEGAVQRSFKKVFITAEKESAPRKPSPYVAMAGDLELFEMPAGRQEIVRRADEPEETMTVQQAASAVEESSSSTVSKVVGRIVMSLFIIVAVVIGLVVIGSLIFRRKGSVS